MKAIHIGLGVAVMVGAISASTQATITVFSDRTSWMAAAGTADFYEDFSGFTSDVQFRTQTVVANGFTLRQGGYDQEFRNLVETSPFQFGDNNGTNHASCYVNHKEPGVWEATTVHINPDADLIAWGADFYGVAGLEILDIDLDGTIYSPNWGGTADFFGFVATPDDAVSAILLQARNLVEGTGG